jgi:hypothetical protein
VRAIVEQALKREPEGRAADGISIALSSGRSSARSMSGVIRRPPIVVTGSRVGPTVTTQ